MKKLLVACSLFFGLSAFSAQTLNDKGLYVDSEGGLFSGTLSSVHDGVRSQFTVHLGQIEGAAAYYYASGKLLETGTFAKGQKEDKWLRYNESGNLSAVAFYLAGKKSGTWLVFDEKGNKRCEMNYTDGQKTGVWMSWDEQGKELEQKDYSRVN